MEISPEVARLGLSLGLGLIAEAFANWGFNSRPADVRHNGQGMWVAGSSSVEHGRHKTLPWVIGLFVGAIAFASSS